MSKRVANTRSKTARNGRVRLGFYTRRRLNAESEAREKRPVQSVSPNPIPTPKQTPPDRPGKFLRIFGGRSVRGMARRMFARGGDR